MDSLFLTKTQNILYSYPQYPPTVRLTQLLTLSDFISGTVHSSLISDMNINLLKWWTIYQRQTTDTYLTNYTDDLASLWPADI